MLATHEPLLLVRENQDFPIPESVIGGWVDDVVDRPIALLVVDDDIVNRSDLDRQSIFPGPTEPLHYHDH